MAGLFMLFLKFDNNSSIRFFTFASRRYARVLLQGGMNDLSLVWIHRFQAHMLPRLDNLGRKSVGQLLQSLLSLGPVVLSVDYDFGVLSLSLLTTRLARY